MTERSIPTPTGYAPLVSSKLGSRVVRSLERLSTQESRRAKLGFRLVQLARRGIVKRSDVPIRFNLSGFSTLAPLSHDLPIYRARFPKYSDNLSKTIANLANTFDRLWVVDVGANIGDSVVIGGAYPNVSYLCIEGAPEYLRYLHENTKSRSDVEVVAAIVGEDGTYASIATSNGTGSLGHFGSTKVRSLASICLSAEIPAEDHLLLKIDTDGFDAEIVCGSSEFIALRRPHVFFEFDPVLSDRSSTQPIEIVKLLVKLGYPTFRVWDNFGSLLLTVEGDLSIRTFEELSEYCREGSDRLHGGTAYLDVLAIP